MLTVEECAEIKEELIHSPTPRAACVDALKVVQRHRGWIDDEALGDVAELLGMSSAELDGVATFYNLIFRQPVGEHVILVCDSISCWLVGSESVLSALERRLGIKAGETTADGKFTLLLTVCLGHCDIAPVMMLDGEIIGNLTQEKIDDALKRALSSPVDAENVGEDE
ncbi:MAG: NADH-quinone oxidoreductase subunit NuoE [Armatimonadetes bacterium]|nr:NADH-quinone oxidoreductase subunit NuoE [Armatimonadota bacterium]